MEIGILMVYLLKSGIYLILLYIFNKLLLSKETLHGLNRAIWLLSVVVAMALPLTDLIATDSDNYEYIALYCSQTTDTIGTENSNAVVTTTRDTPLIPLENVIYIAAIIYLIGFVATLINKIVIYCRLLFFLSRCERISSEQSTSRLSSLCNNLKLQRAIKLCFCPHIDSPLSWMNYIVLDRDEQSDVNILKHELSHIKHRHTIDIIFLDLASIIMWWNPAIWLIKRQLQQVHEYQADDYVLQTGANIKEYQLLLIKKAVGTQHHSIANSFNHSNLKNRITMMLKTKSSRWAAAKAIYALPLALVIATMYANDTVANSIDLISEVKVSNLNSNNEISQPTTQDEKQKPLTLLDGKVIDDLDSVDKNTIAAISVLKNNVEQKVYDEYNLTDEQIKQAKESGMILISSKKSSEGNKTPSNVKRESIDSVVVVGYGTMKKDATNSEMVNEAISTKDGNKIIVIGAASIHNTKEKEPLVVIDGKASKIGLEAIDKIDNNTIESIEVIKPLEKVAEIQEIKEIAREKGARKISYSDQKENNSVKAAKELIPNISKEDLQKAKNGVIVIKIKK